MTMRILHILDHSIPLHSGYTFRTRAILREQRRLGWETFHLTSPKQGPVAGLEEEVDGLHFYRTPPGEGWLARTPVLNQWQVVRLLARRLEEVVARVGPDLLHAHSPALNGLAALEVARRHALPLVYEVRAFWEDAAVDHGTSREGGLRYRATRALETHVVRRAAAVTTICEGLRQDLLARGLSEDRVTVIPNAVDLEAFRGDCPGGLRQRLGLTDNRVLGFIGSFYAYEGLDLLLEALPRVLAGAPDVRLVLVGGGPQEAALKDRTQALGLEDRVRFTGRVPHGEVLGYYDLLDLLVLPRRSLRLTELVTPLKPLEAMARGRPVLASDVGGHRELIRDGDNGLLFKADDAADLATRILTFLEQRDGEARLREGGSRFVETERNWPASVARYRQVYTDALARLPARVLSGA